MILPTISFRIERWKFNKDFGIYVSTLGNFRDRHKRRLPIKVGNKGYCHVKTECPVDPWKLAHRVVMLTWKPIPDAENLTVDHLNHNKRDNSLGNLEWVTKSENLRRARADSLIIKEKTGEVYIMSDPRVSTAKKAKRKAKQKDYKNSILGYSINGEGCYSKDEAIEKLVSLRGKNSRENTVNAFKALENGTNETGKRFFGRQAKRYLVEVIYKQ